MDENLLELERRAKSGDTGDVQRWIAALLRAGEKKRALEALLATWRETRDASLAAAIETLFPAPAPWPEKQEEWLPAGMRYDPEKAPALLATLARGTLDEVSVRMPFVATWEHDPRTASALARLVDEVPFRSSSSQPFWGRVFDALVAHRDPRATAVLEAARAKPSAISGKSMRAWFEKRLDRALEQLPQTADEGTWRAFLIEVAAAPAPRKKKRGTLEKILADPRNDELRLEYARELGDDPRAEAILLDDRSRKGELDRAGTKRLAELLKKHGKEWSGPLAKLLVSSATDFRLGFLDTVRTKRLSPREIMDLEGDPIWSTVDRLGADTKDPELLGRMLRHEVMRFRMLSCHHAAAVVALGPNDRVEAIECLDAKSEPDLFRALGEFPKLTRLSLYGGASFEPRDAQPLLDGEVVRRLESFQLYRTQHVAAWLDALEPTRVQELVVAVSLGMAASSWLDATGFWLRFTRIGGRFAAARIDFHGGFGLAYEFIRPYLEPLVGRLERVVLTAPSVPPTLAPLAEKFPFLTTQAP